MRIALCDDDPGILASVPVLLDSWIAAGHEAKIQTFSNGDELLETHAADAFDVILLDVIMPALNGMEVAREIRRSDNAARLMFLTSSPEFAVESYSVKASNYLLKPISANALFQCLNELESELLASARTILVRGPNSTMRIRVPLIEYAEARGRSATIKLVNGTEIATLEPFGILADKLPLEDGFFKCHRSFLVNINHVVTFTPDEVIVESGCRIPISRSCKSDFKKAYFSIIFAEED